MKTPDFRVPGTKLPFTEHSVEVGYTKNFFELPEISELHLVSSGYIKA
jgi:hypothetical protein